MLKIKGNDYIIEFYWKVDEISQNLSRIIINKFGDWQLLPPLLGMESMLQYILFSYRDRYIGWRENGESIKICQKKIIELISKEIDLQTLNSLALGNNKYEFPSNMKEYKYLFYCNGPRFYKFLEPIIKEMPGKAILILDSDKNNLCVKLQHSNNCYYHYVPPHLLFTNSLSIRDRIKAVYEYSFYFSQMLASSKICRIIGNDGCQTPLKIMAQAGQEYDIQSSCIQSCWPSFFHGGYKKLPYNHFITWGEGFSKEMKKINPTCCYTAAGYPYEVKTYGRHDAITFFLQSPLFLCTTNIFIDIYKLIENVAKKFPSTPILIRSHPDYLLPRSLKENLLYCDNVEFVDGHSIVDVFSRTKIGIAQFSTCLIECVGHGCIPIVYDPVYLSRYKPDIEKLGIGKICSSSTEVISSINEVLNGDRILFQDQGYWFKDYGKSAIQNIVTSLIN